ncbi:MAG TPA: hypothetical protein V6D20_11305 [Candidatus Obscuribacterales bacterium]
MLLEIEKWLDFLGIERSPMNEGIGPSFCPDPLLRRVHLKVYDLIQQ